MKQPSLLALVQAFDIEIRSKEYYHLYRHERRAKEAKEPLLWPISYAFRAATEEAILVRAEDIRPDMKELLPMSDFSMAIDAFKQDDELLKKYICAYCEAGIAYKKRLAQLKG